MNVVSVTSVTIHDNPAKFTDPFKFEITFEANANLAEGLEIILFSILSICLSI